MANEEHLTNLKKGVKEWNAWRKNVSRPNLSEADLSGVNLSRANLSGADLVGANLSRAYLGGAVLVGADLSGANLSRAYLGGAVLSEADLSEADLSGSDLVGANLERADLNGTHLRGAKLSKSHLKGADLSRADLSGAWLVEANLSGANFERAKLGETHLERAQLIEANLERADLSGAHLRGAKLIRADLSRASFIEAELRGASLIEARIRGASFERAKLFGADLSGARLTAADLSGSDLSGTDLSGADLSGSDLSGSDLSGSDLSGADLTRADLTRADLNRAIVHNTNMERAIFTDTKLMDLRMTLDENQVLLMGTGGKPINQHITRSIEFPPEYKAAGIQILSHFEDVLRSKYSDLDVKVTITQEENTVSMTVETDDGEQLEKIEQTLEQYGLVVTGNLAPEVLLDDPVAVLQLKNRLSLAEHEIHMQKEVMAVALTAKEQVIAIQQASIEGLNRLVMEITHRLPASQQPANSSAVQITNSPVFNVTQDQYASQHQDLEITQHLTGLRTSLADLASQLPEGSPGWIEAQEAAKEFEDVARDPDSAKGSPVPKKVEEFFQALGDEKSRLGRTVRGLRKGLEIAQGLARRYNQVAQWVGWPQMPEPLLGGNKED